MFTFDLRSGHHHMDKHKKQLNKIEGEVGMAVQKRYTNKSSWNKVHVTSLLLFK